MPRYGVCYSKEDASRFLSHLDVMRTFERALRRAELPLSYTQGFNPHPKLSFAAPLSVGVAGQCEYLELELFTDLEPAVMLRDLAAVLPEGIGLQDIFCIQDNAPAIMSLIQQAAYQIELELTETLETAKILACIEGFLEQKEIFVMRETKESRKSNKKVATQKAYNIRPGIIALSIAQVDAQNVSLYMVLKTGSEGNVKPGEVIEAMTKQSALSVTPYGISMTRTMVWGPDGQSIKILLEQ